MWIRWVGLWELKKGSSWKDVNEIQYAELQTRD